MESTRKFIDKLNLKSFFSEESLEKLSSIETEEKAKNLTDLQSLKKILSELELPELSDIVIIDDGPSLINENPGWGPCFGEELQHIFNKELNKSNVRSLVDNYESYRFSPKAPGSKSSKNTGAQGAALGAAVGVVFAGAAGGAAAAAAVIIVGAAAGAVGAKISEALRD